MNSKISFWYDHIWVGQSMTDGDPLNVFSLQLCHYCTVSALGFIVMLKKALASQVLST